MMRNLPKAIWNMWYLRICQINILINLFFRIPEVHSCIKTLWIKILGLYYLRCSKNTAFTELRFSITPKTQIFVKVAIRNVHLNHLSPELVKAVYFFPDTSNISPFFTINSSLNSMAIYKMFISWSEFLCLLPVSSF